MGIKVKQLERQLLNPKIVITDWSGVFSDDRMPVYEANMGILEAHGKSRFPFEEWLSRTTATPIEFLANHGVVGDRDVLFEEYRVHTARQKAMA